MKCHTLDRFRGAWLGSMLGSLIKLRKADYLVTEIGLQFFIVREQVAKTTINSQRWDIDAIADLLVEKKLEDDQHNALLKNDHQSDLLTEYSYCLLSLLPVIIFYGDNWNLLQKIIERYCLKLGNVLNSLELEADTLLWSHLIISIFNSSLELDSQNFSQLARKTLINMAAKKTALTAQLEIVITAIERGISLQQLSDRLLSRGNQCQTAIALSCYCFATATSDFKLSVQRASNLDPEIARLIMALTGTLSGAYNGMTGIPLGWKKMANQNTAYSLASQTVLELFRAWLGIYSSESEPEMNLEIQAIAIPSQIQTRKSLKIISQQSLFD